MKKYKIVIIYINNNYFFFFFMNMRLSTYIVRVRQRNSQRTITNSLSPDSLSTPTFFDGKKFVFLRQKLYLFATNLFSRPYVPYVPTYRIRFYT
jgi:hypothetical protein